MRKSTRTIKENQKNTKNTGKLGYIIKSTQKSDLLTEHYVEMTGREKEQRQEI